VGSYPELAWFDSPDFASFDPSDYLDGENTPRAVEWARSTGSGLLSGVVDPVVWWDEVELALEILCDAAKGDPALAFWAIKSAEVRFRRPELWESDNLTNNAVRYARWATLTAEVAHRNERYKEAVVLTSAALDKLEAAAGGRDELLRLIASSKEHPLACAATAADAIRTAALRRASYCADNKEWLRARTAPMLPAAIASGRVDHRTHAFSTQRLFEQVELQRIDYVDDLRQISDATRGSSKRSLATAPLVEMEHCRAHGHRRAAKRAAATAARRIEDFRLHRHKRTIDRYGYLLFG
jgi:hypothetical protein